MHRIPSARFGEPIGEAFRILHDVELGPVRFWCMDPVASGLSDYENISDGRSYRDTAACYYPWHIRRPASDRVVTVVLPKPETVETVIHELGHVIHYRLGFSHAPKPVTKYARRNSFEAFAEAWTAWWYWQADPDWYDRAMLASDHKTLRLFESLTGRDFEGSQI